MADAWGYDEQNGPSHWVDIAPNAAGLKQSPIIIHPTEAVFNKQLDANKLHIAYEPVENARLINNGHSVQVEVPSSNSYVDGGPLSGKYQLRQFHFHWGVNDLVGSEHKIDDKTFSGEMHLVHWDASRFKSIQEAVQSTDGLCVLAVFIEVGTEHCALKAITDRLTEVSFANESVTLSDSFDLSRLLPDNISQYWTYNGSLTTPPCSESVIFIVFRHPIQVSEEQLEAFRSLISIPHESCETCDTSKALYHHIVNNYRPTMPLNDRTIASSFKD